MCFTTLELEILLRVYTEYKRLGLNVVRSFTLMVLQFENLSCSPAGEKRIWKSLKMN